MRYLAAPGILWQGKRKRPSFRRLLTSPMPRNPTIRKCSINDGRHLRAGSTYDWASYERGGIGVGKLFVSKSGSNCRDFTENYTVQGQAATDRGIACKRSGKDGWCKLREGNATTCAMEGPSNMFERTMQDVGDFVNRNSALPSVGNIADGFGGSSSGNSSGGGSGFSAPAQLQSGYPCRCAKRSKCAHRRRHRQHRHLRCGLWSPYPAVSTSKSLFQSLFR